MYSEDARVMIDRNRAALAASLSILARCPHIDGLANHCERLSKLVADQDDPRRWSPGGTVWRDDMQRDALVDDLALIFKDACRRIDLTATAVAKMVNSKMYDLEEFVAGNALLQKLEAEGKVR